MSVVQLDNTQWLPIALYGLVLLNGELTLACLLRSLDSH